MREEGWDVKIPHSSIYHSLEEGLYKESSIESQINRYMILIYLTIILIIINSINNIKADAILFKIYTNNPFTLHESFRLGVSSSKFISRDSLNPHTLSILSLNLLFFDIEVHFIQKINLDKTE